MLNQSHRGPGDACVPDPSLRKDWTKLFVSLFSSVILLRVDFKLDCFFYFVVWALLGFRGLGDLAIPLLLDEILEVSISLLVLSKLLFTL